MHFKKFNKSLQRYICEVKFQFILKILSNKQELTMRDLDGNCIRKKAVRMNMWDTILNESDRKTSFVNGIFALPVIFLKVI